MRVCLLVTGRMEVEGLPLLLRAWFPSHDFDVITRLPDGTPFDGFTSSRVTRKLLEAGVGSSLDKLVQQLCAELVPGRDGAPPDLIVVLDDLELDNMDQPEFVVECFRAALLQHLEKLEQERGGKLVRRMRDALCAKASFHLAVPMAEAWLFADLESLRLAGAPPAHLPPKLRLDKGPEDFVTDDVDYSEDLGCPTWTSLRPALQKRRRKTHRPLWLREDRELHPKAYLSWLCRHPKEKKCSIYRETSGRANRPSGSAALAGLERDTVLQSRCPFFFAFLEDLGEALDTPLALEQDEVSTVTGFFHAQANKHRALLLRNV